MTISDKILKLYLDELKEIGDLDRAYYETVNASTGARREYFKRQERLERLRVEIHSASRTPESTEAQPVKTAELLAVEATGLLEAGRTP
jgi:hypothetical protein